VERVEIVPCDTYLANVISMTIKICYGDTVNEGPKTLLIKVKSYVGFTVAPGRLATALTDFMQAVFLLPNKTMRWGTLDTLAQKAHRTTHAFAQSSGIPNLRSSWNRGIDDQ
jgi:hypothetical protein